MRRSVVGVLSALLMVASGCAKEEEPKQEQPTVQESVAAGTPSTQAAKPAEPTQAAEPAPPAEPAAPSDVAEPAGHKPEQAAPTEKKSKIDPTSHEATSGQANRKSKIGDALASALPYLPSDLVGLLVADFESVGDSMGNEFPWHLVRLTDEKKTAMFNELVTYHKKKLGFGTREIKSVVAFVTGAGDIGLLLAGAVEPGEAEGEKIQGYRVFEMGWGPEASLFLIDGFGMGMYVGAASTLEQYLAGIKDGKQDRAPLAPLADMIGRDESAWLAAAVNLDHPLVSVQWDKEIPFPRPSKTWLTVGSSVVALQVEGSKESLDSLQNLVNTVKEQARMTLTMAKAKLDRVDVAEGTTIIVASHMFDDTINALMPVREGDRLSLSLDIGSGAAFVPLAGVLSAIAIPAFIKYTKKAKTSEAMEMLSRMANAAEVYFCTPRIDPQGNLLPSQFPPSQSVTPGAGTCCGSLGGPDADGDDRCDPDGEIWMTETWNALMFQVMEPHYYVYEFRNNGKTGSEAEFEAVAYGDLDCDGEKSTFKRSGKGSVEGGECSVHSSSALWIDSEME